MKPELALLIDGDQPRPQDLATLVDDLVEHWTVSARLCIRNWRSSKDQATWNETAAALDLECIQHDPGTRGKNATDIELAIRAMDLLHVGYRAFAIVTGDTDFHPLFRRLRRAGCHVEIVEPKGLMRDTKKPASSGRRAKKPAKATATKKDAASSPKKAAKPEPETGPFGKAVRRAINKVIESGDHDKGWITMRALGQQLSEAGERPQKFGYGKSVVLRRALEELPGIDVEKVGQGKFRARVTPA
ncbi:MAG: NYN domain-containing protein [Thermoplasmatota archaeon]